MILLILLSGILLSGIMTILFIGRKDGMQKKMGIKVTLKDGTTIDGEEFVMGMAAAEIPRMEEEEALKAWIIVCRTNFLKAAGDRKELSQEELALDYLSYGQMEANNGKMICLEYRSRLMEASEKTFGKTLFYGEEMIDALYHQVSIGKTISSKEIYDLDVPYLTSVDSSQDVESEEYLNTKILSWKDLADELSKADAKLSEKNCKENLKIEEQTENGYVKLISVKKTKWTGEEWKEIFGLTSPYYYLENYEDRLRIVTLGKGHGMGMSLFGANALAKKGKKAEEILSWYYPGTEIKNTVNEKNEEKNTRM